MNIRSRRLPVPRECDRSSGPGRDLGMLWLQFRKEVKVNRRQSPIRRQESHSGHGKPRGRSEILSGRSQAQGTHTSTTHSPMRVKSSKPGKANQAREICVWSLRGMQPVRGGSREPSVLHADGANS